MKIGKYFLAGLLTAAVVLSAAAQEKQYDVNLTVYPQAKKETVGKDGRKARESAENPRKAYRASRAADRFDSRYYNSPEPAKIEKVLEQCAEAEGRCDKAGGMECGKQGCAGEQPCCKGEKQCGEGGQQCDKNAMQCCKDGQKCHEGGQQCGAMQACPHGQQPGGMHAMHQQMHGAMPMYMDFAQYRQMRRRQLVDFYGDRLYLGTNALALLVTIPNVNLEWRRDERFGVRLSLGGAAWPWFNNDRDRDVFGFFWVTPEVRWYLGEGKSWYAGPMAQFMYLGNSYDETYNNSGAGSFTRNIHDYYTSFAVGGSFGYMQRVSRKFAIDYNIGMGIAAMGFHDGYGDSTEWRATFAPLRTGISFVWQACSKPLKK